MTQALTTTEPIAREIDRLQPSELSILRQTIAKDCTDAELEYGLGCARALGISPFAKQCYFLKFGGRFVFVIALDGYRAIAARDHDRNGVQTYAGSDVPIFPSPQHWIEDREVRSREHGSRRPSYCDVTVWKLISGVRTPYTGRAYWEHVAPRDGGSLRTRWSEDPIGMLAVAAERQALRTAFPSRAWDKVAQIDEVSYTILPDDPIDTGIPLPSLPAQHTPTNAPDGQESVLPTKPVQRLIPNENDPPLDCSIHNQTWVEDRYRQYSHPTDDVDDNGKTVWCRRKKVIIGWVVELAEALAMTKDGLATYVKDTYGRSASTLTDYELWAVYRTLRERFGEQAKGVSDAKSEETALS